MLNIGAPFGLIATAALTICLIAQGQPPSSDAGTASSSQSPYIAMAPEAVKWVQAGSGTEFAVLSGSPDAEGSPFVLRLRFADQVHIPPHWHPVDEHITVIAGTFYMGMGEKYNESTAKEMPAGTYGFMPREMRHFGWAKGTTIVQIHGVGPFKTNWVDPVRRTTPN